MEAQTETMAAERIDQTAKSLGLTMTAVFIPWSASRSAGEKHPSLNWRVTIARNGRQVLETDYGAGSGHCPAYKAPVKRLGGQNSFLRSEAIRWECENGRAAWVMEGIGHIGGTGKPLMPEMRDVLYGLASDSSVLDSGTFEEWAGECGYEPDSRKAEAIYRACLEIALKLRNSLGDAGLQLLRDACQDY